ncbi:hypothetical protein [Dendronalium sp. ChiSLP03b]|uniref:hypothetical protein n=1 Tax=Dendronalium sp. ChiSLP03b TaxID=3075381 RepID=UPI002AD5DDF2|nr:hypothetical protein [Dendronalium sp. ChiSLP03b]
MNDERQLLKVDRATQTKHRFSMRVFSKLLYRFGFGILDFMESCHSESSPKGSHCGEAVRSSPKGRR